MMGLEKAQRTDRVFGTAVLIVKMLQTIIAFGRSPPKMHISGSEARFI